MDHPPEGGADGWGTLPEVSDRTCLEHGDGTATVALGAVYDAMGEAWPHRA